MSTVKLTYLIGAGASAQAIPVVKDFANELINFAEFIGKVDVSSSIDLPTNTDSSKIQYSFVKEINWLAKECKSHSSIDTFARKLFFSR